MIFGWTKRKQKGKPGFLGTLKVFCEAIEEQGKGTLHGPFLIWIKDFALLQMLLHSKNKATQESAQKRCIGYVDSIMSANHGDLSMQVDHACKDGVVVQYTVDTIYENCDKEDLREARHTVSYHTIDGKVLQCKTRKVKERPTYIVSNALQKLKSKLSRDVTIPLPPGLLDITAYRFVYDVDLGNGQNDCNLEDGHNRIFWSD